MSKKQYSPRKQKREKTKFEGEQSKVPEKSPEVKNEKEGEDEILPSAWSDWQWVHEGWYYYRARKGENGESSSILSWGKFGRDRKLTEFDTGKWQYEFEMPETIVPQANSSAPSPAIADEGQSKDDSVKHSETTVQNFSTSTKASDKGGYERLMDASIYNRSPVPYTEGVLENGEQSPPSNTPDTGAKTASSILGDEKEDVKEPTAEKPIEKTERVVRRERGRGRERKKDSVTEWRESVAKETRPKGSDVVDKPGLCYLLQFGNNLLIVK